MKRGLLANSPTITDTQDLIWDKAKRWGVYKDDPCVDSPPRPVAADCIPARRESWIDPGTRWDADGSRDNTWTRLDDFFTGTENWKWHSGGFERPVVDMCNARECSRPARFPYR